MEKDRERKELIPTILHISFYFVCAFHFSLLKHPKRMIQPLTHCLRLNLPREGETKRAVALNLTIISTTAVASTPHGNQLLRRARAHAI